MLYFFLALLLPIQLAGAYALLRAGLRRAPYRWAAWVLLVVWVEGAVVLDRAVVQEARTNKLAAYGV